MAYRDLREFIGDLEAHGLLKRVAAPVSRDLEITEITDRVTKAAGPALLFEKVTGCDMPVLINAFGSVERMAMALGVGDFAEQAARIAELVKPEIPEGFIEKIRKLPALAKMAGFSPSVVRKGVCQEVVIEGDAVDLNRLPALTCWPGDGGRYITFPLIFTRDPETGDRNIGLYRMQVYDRNTTGMHWQVHHDGAAHFAKYRRRGERMPLAAVVGADPVVSYAASAPLPPGMDEAFFAGFLRGKGIDLVKGHTIDIEVPATAEIVLEGYVDPAEPLRREGPFGDHTGFYSLADDYPVFHVTAITHRRDPIYQTIIVGRPPQEDTCMGKATERMFLPLVRTFIPEVIDYCLPEFGVFHNCVFVRIAKRYPFQARKVMHAIWGLGQMMFSKLIVVVDEDVDVQDTDAVLFHVGANVDARRDTVIVDGPVDVLDHASPYVGAGSKMGIDATRKLPGEGVVREWPDPIVMSDVVKRRVVERWTELGLNDIG
ncbi:MAG: 3-octaprenyl-4-hydroxybenzoate carboxy-lyase [Phycisphaerae bacterium]|nr:3-octaprenyl-4-hydroxybenzoate carboxy-lyase [Phycisphaerae bacterium]